MASTSKHQGDVARWIEKVIDSCETPHQEISARHLIQNFEKTYDRPNSLFISIIGINLRDQIANHVSIRMSNFIQIEERELFKEE